jgi:hypothetical protein
MQPRDSAIEFTVGTGPAFQVDAARADAGQEDH